MVLTKFVENKVIQCSWRSLKIVLASKCIHLDQSDQSVENTDFQAYFICQLNHIHVHTHIRLCGNLPVNQRQLYIVYLFIYPKRSSCPYSNFLPDLIYDDY